MFLDIEAYKRGFEEFYKLTYEKKNNSNKAFKDIVGHEYETFRRNMWKIAGYQLSNSQTKFAGWTADIIVKHNDKIVAIEEDKAHYVDSCFLDRFYSNAAKIVSYCLKNNIDVPYIVLSCPTSYALFDKKKNEILELYRKDIVDILNVKVKYLNVCNHDRIIKRLYYKTNNNPFVLNEAKVKENVQFINNINN